jgi:hypothetical protein
MTCARKIGPYDCCSVVQGDCLELIDLLTNIAQILDVVKQEWGTENCWSEWDEEQRLGIIRVLRNYHGGTE